MTTMAGETELSSDNQSLQIDHNSQNGQETQEGQHPSTADSNNEHNQTMDEENNKNGENEAIFAVDEATNKRLADLGSKVIASIRCQPLFPQSSEVAITVKNSRSVSYVDLVDNQRKGKSALTVQTPLILASDQCVVMIEVNYKGDTKGIVYDQKTNTITRSECALSTLVKSNGGVATLNPSEIVIIDNLLVKYLETFILEKEPTLTIEGNRNKLEYCLFFLIISLFTHLQICGKNWRSTRKQ